MHVITFQPASKPDNMGTGGEVMYQKPYPFNVAEDGQVLGTLGSLYAEVVGFAEDCARQQIDLRWQDVAKNPARAVGMYLVSCDHYGNLGVHELAIESVGVNS